MLAQLKSAGACEGCLGLVSLGTKLNEGNEAEVAQALTELRRGAMMVLGASSEA